jgi:hypothetical protein
VRVSCAVETVCMLAVVGVEFCPGYGRLTSNWSPLGGLEKAAWLVIGVLLVGWFLGPFPVLVLMDGSNI